LFFGNIGLNNYLILSAGSTTTVFANVAVDLMGVALLPRSLAVLQFLGGCAGLVSPPLIGECKLNR